MLMLLFITLRLQRATSRPTAISASGRRCLVLALVDVVGWAWYAVLVYWM